MTKLLPLAGGHHVGPLFQIQKRRAPKLATTTLTGRVRRGNERRATPKWADVLAISMMYRAARMLSATTGVAHSVDHIVPLIHPLVCGLHVHWNMRLMPLTENIRKANRSWPGMPFEQMELAL